jgi:hypothetical protein
MKQQIVVIVVVLVLVGAYVGSRGSADHVDLIVFEVATFAGGCFWCMEAAFEPVRARDHYITAIFYHSEEQRLGAEQSMIELDASCRFDVPVVTGILEFSVFYVRLRSIIRTITRRMCFSTSSILVVSVGKIS